MSWKKFGGINQYEKHKSMHVKNIVAEQITFQDTYVGNFEIQDGTLTVEGNIIGQSNVTVAGDISCNGEDVHIRNNLTVSETGLGTARFKNNVVVENNTTLVNKTFFDEGGQHFITGDASGISINVDKPDAILDICGNAEKILQVSSSRTHTRNIMTQNRYNHGIAFEVDGSYASIDFFHKNQDTTTGTPEATIQYDPCGELLFSMGNQVHLQSEKVYISSSNTNNVNNPENATLLVQDHEDPSFKYLSHVFQKEKTNTGTSAHFISSDTSSNTFLSITTKNDIGWQWGGGMDGDALGKEMGTTGFTDNVTTHYYPQEKRYIPAHTYLSGSSLVKNRTSTGINTYRPKVDDTVLDINGPVCINHEEIHCTANFDFEIGAVSFIDDLYGIVVSNPIDISNGFYLLNAFGTEDGGQTWTTKYQNKKIPIENAEIIVNVHMQSQINFVTSLFEYYFVSDGDVGKFGDNTDNIDLIVMQNSNYIYYSIGNTVYNSNSDDNYKASNNAANFTASTRYQGINDDEYVFFISKEVLFASKDLLASGITITLNSSINYRSIKAKGNVLVAIGAPESGNNNLIYNTNYTDDELESSLSITYASTNPVSPESLNDVYIIDSTRSIIVGDEGTIYFSSDSLQTWTKITANMIDGMGNADLLLDPSTNIVAVNADSSNAKTFCFVCKRSDDLFEISGTTSIINKGRSYVCYAYFPNLFDYDSNPIVLDIDGHVDIEGNVSIDRNLTIGKNVDISDNIRIGGNVDICGTMIVDGDVSMGSHVHIDGNVDICGTMIVDGDVSMGSHVHIDGNVDICGTMIVDKDVSLNSHLYVEKNITMSGTTVASNNTNLSLFETNVTDVSFATNANKINIGLDTGVTTINHNLNVAGYNLFVHHANPFVTYLGDRSVTSLDGTDPIYKFNDAIDLFTSNTIYAKDFVNADGDTVAYQANIDSTAGTTSSSFYINQHGEKSNQDILVDYRINSGVFIAGNRNLSVPQTSTLSDVTTGANDGFIKISSYGNNTNPNYNLNLNSASPPYYDPTLYPYPEDSYSIRATGNANQVRLNLGPTGLQFNADDVLNNSYDGSACMIMLRQLDTRSGAYNEDHFEIVGSRVLWIDENNKNSVKMQNQDTQPYLSFHHDTLGDSSYNPTTQLGDNAIYSDRAPLNIFMKNNAVGEDNYKNGLRIDASSNVLSADQAFLRVHPIGVNISGNTEIYGNTDISGKVYISETVDIIKKTHIYDRLDVEGDVSLNANVTIDSAGTHAVKVQSATIYADKSMNSTYFGYEPTTNTYKINTTAFGHNVLQNVKSTNNTAFGYNIMSKTDPINGSLWNNTAFGSNVMEDVSQNCTQNTAIGNMTMQKMLSNCKQNTIIGSGAGTNIKEDCISNTGIGYNTMNKIKINCNNNTTVGVRALFDISDNSSSNTGIGFKSLEDLVSDMSLNTAIGYLSGNKLKQSNSIGNTFLGSDTKVSNENNVYSYSTAVGYGATVDLSHQIVLGTSDEYVNIPSTTQSTSTTSGAVVIAGGIGVGENMNLGSDANNNTHVIKGSVTITGEKTTINNPMYVDGDVSLNSDLDVSGNTHLQSRLDVEGDVSMNSNVEITGSTVIHGQDLQVKQNLNVIGNSTFRNNMRILNENANNDAMGRFDHATVEILHTNTGDTGASSIVFQKETNSLKQYGTLAYVDDMLNTPHSLDYANINTNLTNACLFISSKHDHNNGSATHTQNMVIRPTGHLILDTGISAETHENRTSDNAPGNIIILPNGGNVGIGTLDPSCSFDVRIRTLSGDDVIFGTPASGDYSGNSLILSQYTWNELNPTGLSNNSDNRKQLRLTTTQTHDLQDVATDDEWRCFEIKQQYNANDPATTNSSLYNQAYYGYHGKHATIGVNEGEVIRIDENGHVGIGLNVFKKTEGVGSILLPHYETKNFDLTVSGNVRITNDLHIDKDQYFDGSLNVHGKTNLVDSVFMHNTLDVDEKVTIGKHPIQNVFDGLNFTTNDITYTNTNEPYRDGSYTISDINFQDALDGIGNSYADNDGYANAIEYDNYYKVTFTFPFYFQGDTFTFQKVTVNNKRIPDQIKIYGISGSQTELLLDVSYPYSGNKPNNETRIETITNTNYYNEFEFQFHNNDVNTGFVDIDKIELSGNILRFENTHLLNVNGDVRIYDRLDVEGDVSLNANVTIDSAGTHDVKVQSATIYANHVQTANSTYFGYEPTTNTYKINTTAFGHNVLQNVGSTRNTAFGYNIMSKTDPIDGGDLYNNTAIGAEVMEDVSQNCIKNTAIGAGAMQKMLSNCSENTVIGSGAGTNIKENCSSNTGMGYNTMYRIRTNCTNNTTVGLRALFEISQNSSSNTGIGFKSLEFLASDMSLNTAIGYLSGQDLIQPNSIGNTFLGSDTNVSNQSNVYSYSTAVGYGATIDLSHQIVLGTTNETTYVPGNAIIEGTTDLCGAVHMYDRLDVEGDVSLNANVTIDSAGTHDVKVQSATIYANKDISSTYFGYEPTTNTYQKQTTAFGHNVLQNVNATNNTVFGYNIMSKTDPSNPHLWNNVVMGSRAMEDVSQNCTQNTAIGTSTMRKMLSDCIENTIIGSGAGKNIKENSSSNTGLGFNSLSSLASDMSLNTAIGHKSGNLLTQPNSIGNTFLGSDTKVSNQNNVYSYSTAVGYGATIDSSHQIVLGTIKETTYVPGNAIIKGTTDIESMMSVGVSLVKVQVTALSDALISGSEDWHIRFNYDVISGTWVHGTTYANKKVRIYNDTTIKTILTFRASTISGYTLLGFNENVNPSVTVEVGDYIEVFDDRVYIPGNVGIGTASPTANLHIHQQLSDDAFQSAGSLKFSTNNNTYTWDVGEIESYIKAGQSNSNTNYPGGLAFKTKDGDGSPGNALTTRMVIDASGHVGIGTTAPSYNLDLTSTGEILTGKLFLANSLFYKVDAFGKTLALFGTHSNGGIGFYTTDTTTKSDAKMYITHEGNVGIGTIPTSSTIYKLDVNGNVNMNNLYCNAIRHNGNDIRMAYRDIDPGTSWVDGDNCGRIIVAGDNHKLVINYGSDFSGGTRINSNLYADGNVGIGTTDPSFNLDLTNVGEIRTGEIHLFNDQQTIGTTPNTLALFGKNSHGGIGFYTTDTTAVGNAKMYITHAGNVGIGTTSPAHALDVSGIIQVSNQSTDISYNDSGYAMANRLWLTPTGLYGFSIEPNTVSYHTWDSHKFYTSAGSNNVEPCMTIYRNNVGIGTTAPAYELDVSGNAEISGTLSLGSTLNTAVNIIGPSNNNLAIRCAGGSGYALLLKDAATNNRIAVYSLGGTNSNETHYNATTHHFSGIPGGTTSIYTDGYIYGPSNASFNLRLNSSDHSIVLRNDNNESTFYSTGTTNTPSRANYYRANIHNFNALTATNPTINLNGNTNVSGSLQVTSALLSTSENSTKVATTAWVQSLGFSTGTGYLPTSGGTLTGILITTKVFVNQKHSTGNPTIDLAIGDNDTGFNSNSDGKIQFYSNASARGFFDSTKLEYLQFNATSDYRVKKNVQTISGENYTVDHLRPVSYLLKDSNTPSMGFIAHELQEHFPSAVDGEKDGKDMQSINYNQLIPILVKEIQDLKQEVRSLKQQVHELSPK